VKGFKCSTKPAKHIEQVIGEPMA